MAKIQGKQLVSPIILSGSFSGSFEGDGSNLTGISGGNIETGSFATTGSNTFIGNQIITGSVNISGSLDVIAGITGSLLGTASFATNALTASFAISASHEIIKEVSSSFADTASFAGNLFGTPSIVVSNITASNISASGNLEGDAIMSNGQPVAQFAVGTVQLGGATLNPAALTGTSITLGMTGQDQPVTITSALTASSNISASGDIVANNLSGTNTGDQDLSNLVTNAQTASFAITGSDVIFGNITSSGNISASGEIFANTGIFQGGVSITTGKAIDHNGPNVRIKNTGLEIAAGPLTASIVSASSNLSALQITGSKLAIGSPIPTAAGYNGITSKFNGGAFFNITEESDSVFGIHDSPDGADILRIDTDPDHFLIDPINNGYKVGIGTPTPPQKLTVQGNISSSGYIRVDGNQGGLLFTNNNDKVYFDGNAILIAIDDTDIGTFRSTGLDLQGNITASNNISASSQIVGNSFKVQQHVVALGSSTDTSLIISGSTFDGDARDAQIIYPSHGLHFNSNSSNNHVLALAGNSVGIRKQPDDGNALQVSGSISMVDGDIFGATNITASGNISASGQIIGDVIDTSFETFLNFEAATSFTFIAPFPMIINFTGSSTSSMDIVDFVTASANSSSFSPRQNPPITLNIFDKLRITPSSSGLFTFSGSRII